jgi:hypothetical protein
MENVKLSDFDVFVTDVAEIVGVAFAPVGSVAGGAYRAESTGELVDEVSVPQAGEQLLPPAVNAQVTPALAGSPVTVAFNCTCEPLAVIVENLLVMLTPSPGRIWKLKAKIVLGLLFNAAVIVAVP